MYPRMFSLLTGTQRIAERGSVAKGDTATHGSSEVQNPSNLANRPSSRPKTRCKWPPASVCIYSLTEQVKGLPAKICFWASEDFHSATIRHFVDSYVNAFEQRI